MGKRGSFIVLRKMVKFEAVPLEELLGFVDPAKAMQAFGNIKDFFPRDDYLYKSVRALTAQLGDAVSVYTVYESLTGKRKRIRKTIEEAVLELEQQIKEHHIHDKNILPINRRETHDIIKGVRPIVAELFDHYQFKSYPAMAKHIRNQVSTNDMPISFDYIERLLHGELPSVPTNTALRIAQEMSRMLDNARRRMPDRVDVAYVILSKSRDSVSEPLPVFVARALEKFIGREYKTDRIAVNQALNGFGRAEQLDSLVRKVSEAYGFPSLASAYSYLYDFLDVRLQTRKGLVLPMHVNRKLFALAKVLQIAKRKYGQTRVEPGYLFVQRKEYFKPIEGLKSRGFDGILLAVILSKALKVSGENTVGYYVTGKKQSVTVTEYQTLLELDDRLRDTIALDLSKSQMDIEVYEQFAVAYRQARGPVILNISKRSRLDMDVLTKIRNTTRHFGQEAYLYSSYGIKVEGYRTFEDFMKTFVKEIK